MNWIGLIGNGPFDPWKRAILLSENGKWVCFEELVSAPSIPAGVTKPIRLSDSISRVAEYPSSPSIQAQLWLASSASTPGSSDRLLDRQVASWHRVIDSWHQLAQLWLLDWLSAIGYRERLLSSASTLGIEYWHRVLAIGNGPYSLTHLTD
jgi:hypothetical protein